MPCQNTQCRFNSMKVRLKHSCEISRVYTRILFQFHEGPIKTKSCMSCRRSLICFNSMKVRLKLEKSENEARGSAFQFHEGPIKT